MVDNENGSLSYYAFSDDIFMLLFSPEILASFPAQHIYVISADILALFHPELPAESTALPVIFRVGCFGFLGFLPEIGSDFFLDFSIFLDFCRYIGLISPRAELCR